MHRLIIVEDEAYVRASLGKLVDWRILGCELAGSFESGEDALEFLRADSADIVLSDIRMDGMDGLELARQARELHPKVRIIFLTGYSDFSYAQGAVRLGADEFILKPTDPAELARVVLKTAGRLDQEKAEAERNSELRSRADAGREALVGKFFMELYEGGNVPGSIPEGLPSGPFIPVLFVLDPPAWEAQAKESLQKALRIFICAETVQVYGAAAAAVLPGTGMVLALWVGDASEAVPFAEKVLCIACGRDHRLSAAVGPVCSGWPESSKAIAAMRQRLEHRYLGGNGLQASVPSVLNPEAVREARARIPMLMELIGTGDSGGLEAMLENIKALLAASGDPGLARSAALEMLGALAQMNVSGIAPHGIGEAEYHGVNGAPFLADAFGVLRKIAMELGAAFTAAAHAAADGASANSGASIFRKTLSYLETHYAENLGVDDIAGSVAKHPKYLCRVVKAETGRTIMEHLLDIRMRAALRLLSDRNLNITEVARLVGVPDAQYFAKVFKKTFGTTPTDHRRTLLFSTKALPDSLHAVENP